MTFRPLLASPLEDINTLQFPVLASPKFDGIRAMVLNGQLVSRKLKPIPNHYIRETLSTPELSGSDGELITGTSFSQTTSDVMSEDGCPPFRYEVFDDFTDPSLPFEQRIATVKERVRALPKALRLRVVSVPHALIGTPDELLEYERKCLAAGYEGVMIRSPLGPYKFGRSTPKQGFLSKLKRFTDTEVRVIGFTELYRNANEAETDELGYTKRSSHKENQIPAGVLGALVVEHPTYGVFEVGTGFDAKQRADIFQNQSTLVGRLAKIKFQEAGLKEKPRFPVFLGFRDEIDL